MTYQEFNHIYYRFTKNEKGIKPTDHISTTGYELKEFVDFAIQKMSENNSQLTIDSLF